MNIGEPKRVYTDVPAEEPQPVPVVIPLEPAPAAAPIAVPA